MRIAFWLMPIIVTVGSVAIKVITLMKKERGVWE